MSTFTELLRRGEFVVTAELNPPKSSAASVVRRRAGVLKGFVDAVNITDSNRAVAAMAAIPAAVIVRDAGLDPIVQMTGRDRNRIALQADLLGAAALGLEHFVFMSGDDPKQGNHPDAVNVKDLDGIGLVRMAVTMRDKAQFLSGDEIKQAPSYAVGATASPFTKPMEADLAKTVEKAEAGADFLQTQPVFDLATFSQWLAEVRRLAGRQVTIIAGVLVLRSVEQAERLGKIPGLALGAAVVERIRKADDQEAEGIAMAIETVRSLKALPGVGGVHLYAIEWPEGVTKVVQGAGLYPRPQVKEAKPA
ncbi:MAG TPA: methylenetetrahydrofolate reductase [Candidatus Limnocylindrales bacterium]|nr:methylenetetrahydrofolate reductase [Candidatus Limnocylindrales bacterium]